ncbi:MULTISPECIES: ABC transporter ATP-binding protein [unclassified Micromonospora]|uniref:ABC transporter ATP-binding protein n=1 Tax=unclassified Micromonospora TaxID=2617518 RepID=UPI0033A2E03D
MRTDDAPDGPGRPAVLAVADLTAGYAKHTVLRGVGLTVGEAELVALLGHNGAGKTTLLRSVTGQVKPAGGRVALDGGDFTGRPPSATAVAGMSLVPQGQGVFPSLTIEENLTLAAATGGKRGASASTLAETKAFVFDLFGILKHRPKDRAGSLSGGQRQMLAISMALMTQPRLMLLDEPSTGLAPVLVDEVLAAVRTVNRELGTSVLVVEQDIKRVLGVADRAYVLKLGALVFAGTPAQLETRDWAELF